MERELFKKISNISDDLLEQFNERYQDEEYKATIDSLQKLLKQNQNLGFQINLSLSIIDEKKEWFMELDQNAICINDDNQYMASGVESPHTYLCQGKIEKIRHNLCPSCWHDWDFKIKNPQCPNCDIKLGDDVKILIDSGVCPNCEEGKISFNNRKCDNCGNVIDEKYINWG